MAQLKSLEASEAAFRQTKTVFRDPNTSTVLQTPLSAEPVLTERHFCLYLLMSSRQEETFESE